MMSPQPPSTARQPDRFASALIQVAAMLAGVLPALMPFNVLPSSTLLNQCLAVGLWGGWVLVFAPRVPWRTALTLQGALALVALAALATWALAGLPLSIAFPSFALLVAAMVMVSVGAGLGQQAQAALMWRHVLDGLLVAGMLCGVVAVVQVFAPGWADNGWITASGLPGRAVGNLRQPNHLCSLLLMGVVALVARHELAPLPATRFWPLLALMVFAIELSASRTGAVGLLLLPLWAWKDKSLSRQARLALVAAPLLYALSFGLMAAYSHISQHDIGAGARIAAETAAATESPNSRTNIWSNALTMIAQQPWTGVGYGEFNLAWTLTAFPHRPTAFFDHTHNLLLQILVELGLPLGGVVVLLTGWALTQALRRCARAQGEAGLVQRSALMIVLMVLLHSLVEYPLWYAYFLLPTALAFGVALSGTASVGPTQAPSAPEGGLRWSGIAGLLMMLGGCWAMVDYLQVTTIYSPRAGDPMTLDQRIARSQRSLLFAHHADYAAATTDDLPAAMHALGMQRAVHHLIDGRLMADWARDLADQGQWDLARTLTRRLKDFGRDEADKLEDLCPTDDKPAPQVDACAPPLRSHDWREFIARPSSAAASAGAGASQSR